MEIYLQYTGAHAPTAHGNSQALLTQDKLFVYSSPRERAIDRCGELTVGAYVACSELLYYEDQCWLKIRRGRFSSAAQHSGYLRVEFDVESERAEKQRRAAAAAAFGHAPRAFKRLHQLPAFPVFLCARQRVTLSRIPVFSTGSSSASSSSSSSSSSSVTVPSSPSSLLSQPPHRQLPVASVFQALECRFSDDFTQLSLKVTSPFGLSGWINGVSFHEMLDVVEDPRVPLKAPLYVQNIAPRDGKWMGQLPIRAIPSLQAPRQQQQPPLKSFEIAVAVERKLVKDHVWLRLQPRPAATRDATTMPEDDSNGGQDPAQQQEDDDAWVVERHANTAERVVVPWGCDSVHDERVADRDDYAERFYRNIYGRRALPLRKEPRLDAEVIGELPPGTVLRSNRRVLNDKGQLWIRVAVADAETSNQRSDDNPQESTTFGFAIQSSAKTNVCMLQEIPPPGKMPPKTFFQVVCDPDDSVTVRAEPSATAKELLAVKDRTILRAIGSIYNADEKRVWLQVLREEIEPAMIAPPKTQDPFVPRMADADDADGTDSEQQQQQQQQFVVYIPVSRMDAGRAHQVVLFALGRSLQRTRNPSSVEAEHKRSGGARVVFQGRASKLFGSKLMRPSTIDLKTTDTSCATTSGPVASAAGEDQDPTQALKEEFDAWQRQTSVASSWRNWASAGLSQVTATVSNCVQRPLFGSCLSRRPASQRMYEQLEQDEEFGLPDE